MYYCFGIIILLPMFLCVPIKPSKLPAVEQDISSYLEPDDGYLAGSETLVFLAESDDSEEFGVRYDQVHDAIRSDTYTFYGDNEPGTRDIDYLFAGDEEHSILPQEEFENTTIGPELNYDSDFFRDGYSTDLDDESSPLSMDAIPDEVPVMNDLPETIYPQLLIIIESSLFNIFQQNISEAISYVLAYWNAVDLRYRSFHSPKVRLNIAGIILAKDVLATPYVNKSFVNLPEKPDKRNLLSCNLTLENFAEYFYQQTSYNTTTNVLSLKKPEIIFDAAIAMTAHNLCEFERRCVKSNDYVCPDSKTAVRQFCPSLGSAYYTGAGAYDPSTKKTEAFALVEDVGGFGSILSAAHEVGHLLGASHSILDDNHCPVDDGFIMSYRISVTEDFFVWSNCSVQSIRNFLRREERAVSLFDEPAVGSRIRRVLPGRMYGRHKICDRLTGSDSYCPDSAGDCVAMHCRLERRKQCAKVPNVFVPEGSACGKERVCINSKCVGRKEGGVKVRIGVR